MSIPKVIISQKVTVVSRTMGNGYVFGSLIVLAAASFITKIVFNAMAANPSMSHGLFINGISAVARMFPLSITPAGWAFSIWGLIYLFEAGIVVYSLSLLCRKTEDGPAFRNPPVLPPFFFIFLILNSVFNIVWLFLFDRLLVLASALFLICTALALTLSLAIAASRLVLYKDDLIDQNRSCDVTYIQAVVINGLGMYTTWSIIASLINSGVVLVYKLGHPLSNESACILCLALLGTVAVVYTGLDGSLFESYTRFNFTPYLTLIWALSAIIAKNWDGTSPSSIISAVLLGTTALAFLLKIVLVVVRQTNVVNHYRPMKKGASPN